MSDVSFTCPECGQHLTADETDAGVTVPCPQCGKGFVIPSPTAGPDIQTVQAPHKAHHSRILWIALIAMLTGGAVVATVAWVVQAHFSQPSPPSDSPVANTTPDQGEESDLVSATDEQQAVDTEVCFQRALAALELDHPDYGAAYRNLQSAAGGGHVLAKVQLGELLRRGQGCKQNVAQAADLWREAAAEGDAEAACLLGSLFGFLRPEESYYWYKQASEMGSAKARWALGDFFSKTSPYRNRLEAMKYYRRAAEIGGPDVQFKYGRLFTPLSRRWIAPCNSAEALKWLKPAAESGHAGAATLVGKILQHGIDVKPDTDEARKWYTMGARGGSREAQCLLGFLCFSGWNREPNRKDALHWLLKAADPELCTDAYPALADLYYSGDAGVQDFAEAYKCGVLACTCDMAKSSSQFADEWKKRLKEWADEMGPVFVMEGQKRLRDYLEKKKSETRERWKPINAILPSIGSNISAVVDHVVVTRTLAASAETKKELQNLACPSPTQGIEPPVWTEGSVRVFAEQADAFRAAKWKLLRWAKEAGPAEKSPDGLSALHVAARYGELDLAKAALAKAPEINVPDRCGRTPFHTACLWGQTEVATLLRLNGADKNARDYRGHRPADLGNLMYDSRALKEIFGGWPGPLRVHEFETRMGSPVFLRTKTKRCSTKLHWLGDVPLAFTAYEGDDLEGFPASVWFSEFGAIRIGDAEVIAKGKKALWNERRRILLLDLAKTRECLLEAQRRVATQREELAKRNWKLRLLGIMDTHESQDAWSDDDKQESVSITVELASRADAKEKWCVWIECKDDRRFYLVASAVAGLIQLLDDIPAAYESLYGEPRWCPLD